MSNTVHIFFSIWMKFFFLLTPFFVLSMFLSLTSDLAPAARRKLAVQVTAAVLFSRHWLHRWSSPASRISFSRPAEADLFADNGLYLGPKLDMMR